MPLYEYECENRHRFEKIQKFSDPPVAICPTCGAAVRKLMSSPAIQFKGSGWYITDYAKKDAAAGKSEQGDKGEKADTKGETKKTETKPDASASPPASPAPKTSDTQ